MNIQLAGKIVGAVLVLCALALLGQIMGEALLITDNLDVDQIAYRAFGVFMIGFPGCILFLGASLDEF